MIDRASHRDVLMLTASVTCHQDDWDLPHALRAATGAMLVVDGGDVIC
jgi:hypothetical protein